MLKNVNWSNIDNEVIHIPSAIQPHGVLLALSQPELTILQVSNNSGKLLGKTPKQLLNQSLNQIFPDHQIEIIRTNLQQDNLQSFNPIKLFMNKGHQKIFFDGIIHRVDGLLVLELEPTISGDSTNFAYLYNLIKIVHQKLIMANKLEEIYPIIVQEVRKLTGLDRVMIYKFDSDQHGVVLAESVAPEVDSFLGLHYPATDIPLAARQLYTNNWLRLIANVDYQPAIISPIYNPLTNNPLDLSFSVLRSVSKCHLQYLKNMGVKFSMSISIIKDKKLWGLIACHHYAPKYIPYEIRLACEFIGQSLSLELIAKEEYEDYEYRLHIKSLQNQIIAAVSQSEDWMQVLIDHQSSLLSLVSAEGFAVCSGDYCQTVGKTPSIKAVKQLVKWLDKQVKQTIFATDCLAKLYLEASDYTDTASGLMSIAITPPGNSKYVLWFRPEVIKTVNWAGNPETPINVEISEHQEEILTPRQSFELWKEIVRSQSHPWQKVELEVVAGLRDAIVNIILHQAEEIARLNQELQASAIREREKALELEKALQELKRMQTQLIQSEKMSTLGQLVAGIAHEINNPINFIYGNLSYANDYANDLLELLELYQQKYLTTDPEVTAKSEEIELDYLREDLPKLLESMRVGAERISKMVLSLRSFSRVDESQLKSVNIHDGLEGTLLILQNRLRSKSETGAITVIKNYGCQTQIECYPSLLNQVFLNILTNAIDALESYREIPTHRLLRNISAQSISKSAHHQPQITITTTPVEAEKVKILIHDNGPGMPPEVQAHIYDPFFTTKPAGEGTGLGLAMAYSVIVEQHKGQLICKSTWGEGTEFTIEIPIKQ